MSSTTPITLSHPPIYINGGLPFTLKFDGVPYYERTQELCDAITELTGKSAPTVEGDSVEQHHDTFSRGLASRMFEMSGLPVPSKHMCRKLKTLDLSKFPRWTVTQNGITSSTAVLRQRMVALYKSDHSCVHFIDGQKSGVNRN